MTMSNSQFLISNKSENNQIKQNDILEIRN